MKQKSIIADNSILTNVLRAVAQIQKDSIKEHQAAVTDCECVYEYNDDHHGTLVWQCARCEAAEKQNETIKTSAPATVLLPANFPQPLKPDNRPADNIRVRIKPGLTIWEVNPELTTIIKADYMRLDERTVMIHTKPMHYYIEALRPNKVIEKLKKQLNQSKTTLP